ncbi:MAG: hypothetical protein JWP91_2811 [Fibrobacteres bacterium]|nr:hypothetical protein [Fibrobacterota bacterium]
MSSPDSLPRLAAACTVMACLAAFSPSFAVNHAFDQAKGALSVDYARYLSKHDIAFNKPITDPKHAMTVGNGRVGAAVWNAKGITMQVTGVDASPQTCFSQGQLNLSTLPRMDTGYASFQQVLSLYDGTLTTRYDDNRAVTVMGSPNSEVIGIHVDDSRAGVQSITFDLTLWDPATQMVSRGGFTDMQADVRDINVWKAVSSFAEPTVAGISRAQADLDGFGYTLAATVEGTPFTTAQVDARTVRFTITPAKGYTIWIACASRLNAPGHDSPAQARTLLGKVKADGYPATVAAYAEWWHAFWGKSFVQYSNPAGEADFMETFYYLSTYLIASGSYGKYPFHFINGVYRSNADLDIHWSGAYWYWNMRNIYNGLLTSNHPDAMEGFYRLYYGNLARTRTITQTRHSIDGAWVPETMRWDGGDQWSWGSDYTRNIYSTGAEAASNMFLRFAYTNDTAWLASTAYPYMREAAKFLQAKLSLDAGTKRYYMASSNAHETYWNVKNAITDLAAVRSLFPQAIQAAAALNLDPALRTQWRNTLDNLEPYKTEAYNGGTRYLPHDPPTVVQKNGENITSELIWPYAVSNIGGADHQTALNGFNSRPSQFSNVWAPDAIQAARLGLGDESYNAMKRLLGMYANYPNGRTNNTNGEFEYVGAHILALNESLLQSHNDTIRVFPAAPSAADFTGRFTLAAKGGFLITSEREAGEIKYVGLKSLHGKPALIANPWGTQQVRVQSLSDGRVLETTAAAMIGFATTASGTYLIERTAKPLSGFTFAGLTGAPNRSAKTLTWNSTVVTLGAGQGKVSSLPRTANRIPVARAMTLLVPGGRFTLPGSGTRYSMEVFDLGGRRIRTALLGADRREKSVDLGLSGGMHIVRLNPVPPD